MTLRSSVGTLYRLGLRKGSVESLKTAYLMLDGVCMFNCSYCTHASTVKNLSYLSRVLWPEVEDLSFFFERLAHSDFERVCVQVVSYPKFQKDLFELIERLKASNKAISVSVRAVSLDLVNELFKHGVDRLGIAIDVVNEELFRKFRGGNLLELKRLIETSARSYVNRITTHIIVGLGESDKELFETMVWLRDINVETALFAFIPLKGTILESHPRPSIERYRKIQLARFLIYRGLERVIEFEGETIKSFKWLPSDSYRAFLTSGCPDCTRPYYNENPSGPLYNVHSEELLRAMSNSLEVIG
ncbi:radical SAM protein [Pseudothermotoga sp.]|nr:radical SAM protein [Pseudothermotoga sp.]MCX7812515.1 radical SAM protein [Pseudothermotoga sp.]MDW8138796.1 radical SAM protein [Pseudothermotoga sp.]